MVTCIHESNSCLLTLYTHLKKSVLGKYFPLAHFTSIIAPVFDNRKYSFAYLDIPFTFRKNILPFNKLLDKYPKKYFSELLSLHLLIFAFFLILASLGCSYTYLGVWDICPQVLPKIYFFKILSVALSDF